MIEFVKGSSAPPSVTHIGRPACAFTEAMIIEPRIASDPTRMEKSQRSHFHRRRIPISQPGWPRDVLV